MDKEYFYILQVTIDTFVQRLGDAAAAGVYKMAETLLLRGPSAVAICALPVSVTLILCIVRAQMQLLPTNAVSAGFEGETVGTRAHYIQWF